MKFYKLVSRNEVMFNKIDRWKVFVMQWRVVDLLISTYLGINLNG